MFKNYFKIAWRNLERSKIYSAINIIGLAIGLAACMLIVLYVGHESTYDRFHKNADRIFWIQGKMKMGTDSMFMPKMSWATAPITKDHAPFVEDWLRIYKDFKTPIVQCSNNATLKFEEPNFLFADSNFFNFFSFNLVSGNSNQVLKDPFAVVISQQSAIKYFGNSNPIGKTIKYNKDYTFVITGISTKAPSNSSIAFDFIGSLSSLGAIKGKKPLFSDQMVQMGAFSTYFLLKNKKDAGQLESTMLALNKLGNKEANERYIATPITNTHTEANYTNFGNIKYLKAFPFIAGLILLLAVINYVSLSTARSAVRAKEVGVRKVLGAERNSIALQFFTESALYSAIGFVIGFILCSIFQPVFFKYLGIDIDHSFLYSPIVLLAYSLLFIITVILAAAYPSMLLSGFKPVKVLAGKFGKQTAGLSLRKTFTIIQFAVAIALTICIIVIDRQMFYIKNANTGVARNNVLMIPFAGAIGKHYAAFNKDVTALSSIQMTASSTYPMYKGYDMFFTNEKGTNKNVSLPILNVNENFIPLLDLKWKIPPADSFYFQKEQVAVLNETAVEKMNFTDDPLKESFRLGNGKYQNAGVLKDFNYQSLQGKIGALCLLISSSEDSLNGFTQDGGCFYAKLKANTNAAKVISQIKQSFERYENTKPFEFYFLDEAYDNMYKSEETMLRIFGLFTGFTLFIACLGLFGLSSFMAVQRTKEIGIRKVLGASVKHVTALLTVDYIKLILIAVILAAPIAWWIMNSWLDNFAYRIAIDWWVFALAALLAILVAVFTIGYHAIKAAVANPVKSLKTE
jgi:putative ABC transport system permease protein